MFVGPDSLCEESPPPLFLLPSGSKKSFPDCREKNLLLGWWVLHYHSGFGPTLLVVTCLQARRLSVEGSQQRPAHCCFQTSFRSTTEFVFCIYVHLYIKH